MNKKAENFLLKIVSNGYEDIAESFNETRKKPMKPMVLEIVKSLNIFSDKKILDLGCGNGRFLDILEDNKNYLGIDNSEKLINFAKEKYGERFQVLDILKLDKLEEDNFDFIFSWAVFHHVPGTRLRLKFLKDVYSKIKDEGFFVFSVWKLRNRKNFLSLALYSYFKNLYRYRILDFGDLIFDWRGNKNNLSKSRYYHAFSKKSLRRIVERSGFKVDRFIEDDFNYYYILKK